MMAGRGSGRGPSHDNLTFSVVIFYAGSCRPNPGRGSIGFVIRDSQNGRIVKTFGTNLGSFTIKNNAAHYKALIAGLQHALWLGVTHITAFGHCLHIPLEVNKFWEVDDPILKRYRDRVLELGSRFRDFRVCHIYKDENSHASDIAREGFYNTFVDKQNSYLERKILQKCSNPQAARRYILEHRCNGCSKIQYILDVIRYRLPQSYAAVLELGRELKQEMGVCSWCEIPPSPNSKMDETVQCMACLIAMY